MAVLHPAQWVTLHNIFLWKFGLLIVHACDYVHVCCGLMLTSCEYCSSFSVSRAVATGLVSPVSTGPLFPSPIACLASPNRANAGRAAMACTQCGDMLKHNTSAKESLLSLLTTFFLLSERLVSQASSARGVACEISEWKAAI